MLVLPLLDSLEPELFLPGSVPAKAARDFSVAGCHFLGANIIVTGGEKMETNPRDSYMFSYCGYDLPISSERVADAFASLPEQEQSMRTKLTARR